MKLYYRFFALFVFISVQAAIAQDVKVSLGPDEIGENQAWTITVSVQNDRLKSYDNFPDITGFRKRGTSTQSTTNIINGQVSSTQSVVMTYLPMKQGVVTVPPFSIKVNDKSVSVPGKKVRVGPPVEQRDPFSDFFDRSPADEFFGRRETEFVDVRDDAFLAMTTSKDEVYVGEGFNATLSFFVSEDNRAPLQFHNLAKQLSDILKKIKPDDSWEENFNIENIEGESILINGKHYTQYKIYQATFYPLNSEDIVFPSVGLEMIKYKVAKNPSFFGQNRKEDFKTFFSKQKTVRVKDLPPHPLRDVVAVGDYRLTENMPTTSLETGKSAAYTFSIYGEGNISAIQKPVLNGGDAFEFYEPNVRQDVNRNNGKVTGTKSFNYFMIPREPGSYKLGEYFRWVYFNSEKGKYDTLKSKIVVDVRGESKKNESIQSNDLGSFYDKISIADNNLRGVSNRSWYSWIFNAFIVAVLGTSAYLVFKK